MSARLAISDVKAMLIERLDPLVRQLVPGAKAKGGIFTARCPWRMDRNEGSFVVWRAGKAKGGWKDYATDEKGDVIDLIAFAQCGAVGKASKEQAVAAVRWAENWLGVASCDPQRVAAARARAQQALSAAQKRDEEARKRKRRRAYDLWMSAKDWRGTLAETYLLARGIDARGIENWADGFRFIARLDHWLEKGFYGPALVAPFRHPEKGFAGLHAVWLKPDGSGKASVSPPKLTLGLSAGSCMIFTRGEGETPPIAFCEGPEDGASVALSVPELSARGVGGLSNLKNQIIPAGTPYVVVCADNDWEKPQAQDALEKAVAALRAQGAPVEVARSHHGKDMNDLIRKKG